MQKIVAKYVYDRFCERDRRVKYNLFNSCINFTNVLLCNYCTKIFVIVVNTCVCRCSVDNKALILSYPTLIVSSPPSPPHPPYLNLKVWIRHCERIYGRLIPLSLRLIKQKLLRQADKEIISLILWHPTSRVHSLELANIPQSDC